MQESAIFHPIFTQPGKSLSVQPCTCVVGLLHLALALQDGVVVAAGKVDVGVVHPRALRHRSASHLLQPLDVQGVHVVGRRVGVVGAQMRVYFGHVGGGGGAVKFHNLYEIMFISGAGADMSAR